MEYRIEEHEKMLFCAYLRNMNSNEAGEEIPKFWDEYYQSGRGQQVPGYLGICKPDPDNKNEVIYGIGCNCEDVKQIPEGFQRIEFPACSWIIFKSVGALPDAIQNEWKKIYEEWMPCTTYELIQDCYIENYLPGDSQANDYVSEIWLPIKKKD